MDTSNSISAAQYSAGISILRSANKQPELALELLIQTLAGTQAPTPAPADGVPVAAGTGTTGQIIDIIA
ncbi:MAG: hypothetical protein OEL83_15205 [Desulforhopalus sp.]|nr:hypothetical protein [Desulforhopalus sp.]